MSRVPFDIFIRDHDYIIGEVVAEIKRRIVANVEDDAEQGYQLNKALYAAYLEWLATPPESKMIDTDRADDARGINRETRGIYG
jgi:hypothetical protein